MSNIFDFINEPYENLKKLPNKELNDLYSELRSLYFSKSKDSNKIDDLMNKTGYYYGVIGMKIAQVLRCEKLLERELELKVFKAGKETERKTTQKEIRLEDVKCLELQSKIDDVKAILQYLINTREALYIEHYNLRNQWNKYVNSNAQGRISENKYMH